MATTKGIDANLVRVLMMQAVEYRFGASQTATHEVEWLSDNGSCYLASNWICPHIAGPRVTVRYFTAFHGTSSVKDISMHCKDVLIVIL